MQIDKILGSAAGIIVPTVIFSAAVGAAPVGGGAAIMFALKRLGFGAASRGILTLSATGIAADKVVEASVKKMEEKLEENAPVERVVVE